MQAEVWWHISDSCCV